MRSAKPPPRADARVLYGHRARGCLCSRPRGPSYVSALLEGVAPVRLVVVATEELVEPSDPVLVVETLLDGAAVRSSQGPDG
jgi:hypothetical protein